jgi:hypothetical protein
MVILSLNFLWFALGGWGWQLSFVGLLRSLPAFFTVLAEMWGCHVVSLQWCVEKVDVSVCYSGKKLGVIHACTSGANNNTK